MFESQRYMHRHKAITSGMHTGYIYVRTYMCVGLLIDPRITIWYIHSHASLDSSCQPPWGGCRFPRKKKKTSQILHLDY